MGVSARLCTGDFVCDFGTSSWLSHVFGVWEIIPVIVRRWVLSSMTKVAQAALRQQGGNATLVRLSKAADVDVANVARSRVVLWVPANVASGPTRGRKPTNQYGAYRVNFSFDSLVPFDVRNDNGVERATLACVLFHTQGVQVWSLTCLRSWRRSLTFVRSAVRRLMTAFASRSGGRAVSAILL